jgi:menaquinone-dependent protoporphyrinogen oxidase
MPAEVKEHKPVAVLYGSSTNPARVISQRVAESLRAHGFPTESHSLQDVKGLDLSRCVAAVLVSPVPMGDDEKAVMDFVKAHRSDLERLPAAFVSLALGRADAEPREEMQDRQGRQVADTRELLDRFFAETCWHPGSVHPLAGAVSYTHYNFVVRWCLKLLAGKQGPRPDSSREDWEAVDDFVNEFVQEIRAASPATAMPSEDDLLN